MTETGNLKTSIYLLSLEFVGILSLSNFILLPSKAKYLEASLVI
jgi:hypothetical protein